METTGLWQADKIGAGQSGIDIFVSFWRVKNESCVIFLADVARFPSAPFCGEPFYWQKRCSTTRNRTMA
jgi:hypothetical protein